MNEKTLYFAYGSNLNLDQMARRCPDAEPVGRVRLDGYRLAFRRTGGGYLTILPDKGNHVDGLLWKVSAQDEQALNHYEGFPHFYILMVIYSSRSPLSDACHRLQIFQL